MSIKISLEKMKNLESASLVVERLRLKMESMNDSVLADFDLLAKSVTDIIAEHSFAKRMEASNFKNFNQDYEEHRLTRCIQTYFCVKSYRKIHNTPHYSYSTDIERDTSFVDNLIINGNKEPINRNLSTLDIWLWADRRLTDLDGHIVCIDEIKRLDNSRDYEIIYSVY